MTILNTDKTIAVFDIDWTLIKPISGSTFPKDAADWQWLRKSVPSILNQYHEEQYTIIFWTNQTKPWKTTMIENMISQLNFIPYVVICGKGNYKPDINYFWNCIGRKFNYDHLESFMCGDALNRIDDHSSCDLDGSIALGIDCYAPEDIFPDDKDKNLIVKKSNNKEIIIMCGYPGSGKTTIGTSLESAKYKLLSLDEYKTVPKIINYANTIIKHNSLIFDATNMTVAKRKVYVDFATLHEVECRCVFIEMSVQKAIDRISNRVRDGGHKVPKIALYKLRKTFEMPCVQEGFKLLHFTVD